MASLYAFDLLVMYSFILNKYYSLPDDYSQYIYRQQVCLLPLVC